MTEIWANISDSTIKTEIEKKRYVSYTDVHGNLHIVTQDRTLYPNKKTVRDYVLDSEAGTRFLVNILNDEEVIAQEVVEFRNELDDDFSNVDTSEYITIYNRVMQYPHIVYKTTKEPNGNFICHGSTDMQDEGSIIRGDKSKQGNIFESDSFEEALQIQHEYRKLQILQEKNKRKIKQH